MKNPNEIPKTVLIVDDDLVILKLMATWLKTEGYAACLKSESASALDVVKDTRLLAVFLDLHLAGGIDGFELLKKIKVIKPALPVVIVTGSHDENEAKKAFDLGAWDYVTKPIDFTYLKNILLLQAPE